METVFILVKDKKEIGVTLSSDFPKRYVDGCPERKILLLKYQHL